MMRTSVRLTLKQHHFEVGAAVLGALVLGLTALVVVYRLNAIHVPAGCFDAWLTGGGAEGAGDCAEPVQAFAGINENEAGKVLAAMAVLPFAVGLLAGVPLIGRELESRTALTAWSLDGSRLRWLGRQLLPVGVLALVTVTFAALAVDVLEQTRAPWYHSEISDMALHGPIVVARSVAALGLGLLAGAVVARTLPAFIVGALAALLLLIVVGTFQAGWLRSQGRFVAASNGADFDGIQFAQLWRAPDGSLLDVSATDTVVPASAAEAPFDWLAAHGYQLGYLGVPTNVALGWVPYEVGAFAMIGVASLAGAAVVVNRRRPS